ncbi:MAG: bifunctional sugar-1-phosphate nucleotidylyltransferase/acetyltransferase [Methanosarcina thermophila]|jgi:UDP-N-acetylglucosamine diphosphorylase/glucosamine-1-phosphate N-acetyltransferase|uniref:Bifunctional protein GlmU n=3 Tax=Methanosarcina thermophila TaxID=2210 RepID=A0A0E3KQZ4_METTE|nr:bifunctional sugar-1-phosphate nucleotidylyltransferase/acetyltransferase [Methanosarcina thermophila]ALK05483.1 MAG: glucose-1-phosphate thymidylyltransferase [Methanosarcina sp. 795]AKB14303.1 Glucose-1-phosphate thymidylyltransferase [Methanosarcina thermophila TM-1]AKB15056.1 Glucose-1-phosphate thymidylyltransferase [Methanosarcina thermophila CHTI-55]NLU58289.1 NTP transferase domain-containing protein [Methanosarcina thermophila]BAW29366.1 glucose-1-phosphate thymidylyltransferase [M
MKAIILAAGEGLRCRPLTLTRSKVMLPIANRPILEHVIDSLEKNRITDIILVVGYKKERIMDYFEDGLNFGVKIKYIEQKAQLGTAHAIEQAKSMIGPEDSEFLVLNGDNLVEPKTIADLLNNYEGDASLLTVRMEDTAGYGVVLTDKKRVTRILEKRPGDLSRIVNTGIYVFTPQVFETIEKTPISENGEYAITDTLQLMIDEGKIVTSVPTESKWLDAVHSWDLLKANAIVLDSARSQRIEGEVEEGAVIRGNVTIGKNTRIRSGTYILGPAVIGENCDIGPNVVILPSTTIGDNVSIRSFTEIQNSIIMNDCRIYSHGQISNSIIGSNNTIGSGFFVEEKEGLSIIMNGTVHRAPKLGTIFGDDNRIGNSVLVKAGVTVAVDCQVESGNTIYRDLPHHSVVL